MALVVPHGRADTVYHRGAPAGCVLCGVAPNNRGLRLRPAQDQQPRRDGPIAGPFVILDAGDNKHAGALRGLLHRATDAGEVLAVLRARHPVCVSVVNAATLAVEQGAEAGAPAPPDLRGGGLSPAGRTAPSALPAGSAPVG
jgi:hypothetical protein